MKTTFKIEIILNEEELAKVGIKVSEINECKLEEVEVEDIEDYIDNHLSEYFADFVHNEL